MRQRRRRDWWWQADEEAESDPPEYRLGVEWPLVHRGWYAACHAIAIVARLCCPCRWICIRFSDLWSPTTGSPWREGGREEPFVPDGRLTGGGDLVAGWGDDAAGDRDMMVRHDFPFWRPFVLTHWLLLMWMMNESGWSARRHHPHYHHNSWSLHRLRWKAFRLVSNVSVWRWWRWTLTNFFGVRWWRLVLKQVIEDLHAETLRHRRRTGIWWRGGKERV
jgi:hypothetical protein